MSLRAAICVVLLHFISGLSGGDAVYADSSARGEGKGPVISKQMASARRVSKGIAGRLKNQRTAGKDTMMVDVTGRSELKYFFSFGSERELMSYAKKGFLNQHQTGTSTFEVQPELRLKLEQAMIGRKERDPVVLPKYTVLEVYDARLLRRVKGFAGPTCEDNCYGDVAAVMGDHLKQRASFTLFDSLARLQDLEGSATTKSVSPKLNTFKAGKQPLDLSLVDNRYFEAQVYGPVGLSDVKYFIVKPGFSGRLLAALKKLGKPVYERLWEGTKIPGSGKTPRDLEEFDFWLPGRLLSGEGHPEVASKQAPWLALGISTTQGTAENRALRVIGARPAVSTWSPFRRAAEASSYLEKGQDRTLTAAIARLYGTTAARAKAMRGRFMVRSAADFERVKQAFGVDLQGLAGWNPSGLGGVVRSLAGTEVYQQEGPAAFKRFARTAAARIDEALVAALKEPSTDERARMRVNDLVTSRLRIPERLVGDYLPAFQRLYREAASHGASEVALLTAAQLVRSPEAVKALLELAHGELKPRRYSLHSEVKDLITQGERSPKTRGLARQLAVKLRWDFLAAGGFGEDRAFYDQQIVRGYITAEPRGEYQRLERLLRACAARETETLAGFRSFIVSDAVNVYLERHPGKGAMTKVRRLIREAGLTEQLNTTVRQRL